ncbi:MAG TPA: hypothetical protein DEW09_18770 [Pseudomonas sp.]|nr:hypothetical protein [Pseudomonas sp.]
MTQQQASTKRKLLDAGRLLICSHGFGGMGTTELLQTANISRGSFYHHFGSKEGLGLQLLHECFDDCFSGLQSLERVSSIHHFRNWLESLFARNSRALRVIAQLNAESQSLPMCMRSELAIRNQCSIAMLSHCVETLTGRQNHVHLIRHQATTIYGLWLGVILLGGCEQSSELFEAAIVATCDLIEPR